MKARDFCYWLQGYFELLNDNEGKLPILNTVQVAAVRQHLALVFKHEIDPAMGDSIHQQGLNAIHNKPITQIGGELPDGTLIRC